MTKREYLTSKFTSIGIKLTDADLLDMKISDIDNEVSDVDTLYIKFIRFIPNLLLRPKELSEGGTTISRPTKVDIVAFYSSECSRLGIKNEMEKNKPKPRVRIW